MSAWIGPAGSMVELLKSQAKVSGSRAARSTFRSTIGGRVKEQRTTGLGRRSWAVSTGMLETSEAAAFSSLLLAGTPPWCWVTDAAARTNLLTPEQSLLLPGTWSGTGVVEGGTVVAADGAVGIRSVAHTTGGQVEFVLRDGSSERPPVIAGVPATWSLYVRGAGNLQLQFVDYAGSVLSTQNVAYSTGTVQRVSMTRTPPAGSARVRLWATGALQAALPSLSWTSAAVPWAVGAGCTRATVDGFDDSRVPASAGVFANYDFEVREVG